MSNKRPGFLKTYLKFASELIDTKPRRLFPSWFVCALIFGALAAWFIPASFWDQRNWGVSATVYSGLLVLNGLFLALGWNAFSRSYEIISSGEYAEFMKRNDVLLEHLFFIELVHYALVLSVIVSGFGLIALLLPIGPSFDRVVFAGVVSMSIYSLINTLSATRMMNDLIWDKAHYIIPGKQHLRAVENREN